MPLGENQERKNNTFFLPTQPLLSYKVAEEVKKLAHSSDDAQFIQLQKYNSVVAGLHPT